MTTLPRNKIKNDILGLKINFSIIPYIDKTTGKNCVRKSRGGKSLKNSKRAQERRETQKIKQLD